MRPDPSSTFGPFNPGPEWQSLVEPFQKQFASKKSFTVDQNVYISGRRGPERNGVCRAMTLHWLGRYHAGKQSYADSKKGPVAVDVEWTPRMAKKFAKYAKMQKQGVIQNLEDCNLQFTGTPTKVLGSAFDDVKQDLVRRPGKEVMTELLSELAPDHTYLIGFTGASKDGLHGHAAGLVVEGDRVRFMEPNLGEFIFDLNDEKVLTDFFSEWYDRFAPLYGDAIIQSVEVEPK